MNVMCVTLLVLNQKQINVMLPVSMLTDVKRSNVFIVTVIVQNVNRYMRILNLKFWYLANFHWELNPIGIQGV